MQNPMFQIHSFRFDDFSLLPQGITTEFRGRRFTRRIILIIIRFFMHYSQLGSFPEGGSFCRAMAKSNKIHGRNELGQGRYFGIHIFTLDTAK